MGETTARPGPEAMSPDPVPVALDFLRACRDEGRPLALVSGAAGTGKALLMRRLLNETIDSPVAHLKNPTGDPHEFLESLLGEFGFDAVESTTSELLRLTSVYMLHESYKGRRPVVIVEEVQDYGPAVWDKIHELAIPATKEKPASLFVLTCNPGFDSEAFTPAFDSVYSLDVTVSTAPFVEPPDCEALEIFFEGKPFALHRLDRAKSAIGRNGANDIHISGPFVSRFHAVVAREDGGTFVIDLQSTNGTYVNGERVTRRRLQAGDVIEIEGFTLRFVDPQHAEQQPQSGDRSDALVMQAPLDHLLDRPA